MITPLEAKLQRQFINKFSETSRLRIKKYYIEQTKINVNAYKESFELEVESLVIGNFNFPRIFVPFTSHTRTNSLGKS